MTDVFTTAKNLDQQTVGGNTGIWGTILNTNFGLIDQALGGTAFVAITGNTVLSSSQAQNTGYEFTGALTGNATITWPPYQGLAVVYNNTTGSHSLVCGLATGATVTVPNATVVGIWSDGAQFLLVTATGGGAPASTTGSGATVLQTSPTLITPNIGVATGTSLALSGAMSSATAAFSGAVTAGSLTGGISVVPKTANYTVLSGDSGIHFTNALATGTVNFTLPAVALGLRYGFTVVASQILRVTAGTSTVIAMGTTSTATAGNVSSAAPYSTITILGVSNAAWAVTGATDSWTIT